LSVPFHAHPAANSRGDLCDAELSELLDPHSRRSLQKPGARRRELTVDVVDAKHLPGVGPASTAAASTICCQQKATGKYGELGIQPSAARPTSPSILGW